MTRSADQLVAAARLGIRRLAPHHLERVLEDGGLVIDIRPEAQRRTEGPLYGAIVIERNVLEWRLDPAGDHRIPEVRGYDQEIVIACSEGYASSLAAASLVELGFHRAADLVGGYRAWRTWFDHSVVVL